MLSVQSPEHFMRQALTEAEHAHATSEIPVGAIVVSNGRVIAKAHNQVEQLQDCTAHAEMIALTAAQNFLGSKYLNDCQLYVTLEPCIMCAGALFWSQIGEVFIGARDDKRGFNRLETPVLHPRSQIHWGVLEEECAAMITQFFTRLRRNNL